MGDATPEYWTPVVGYVGFYEVSSLGRVKSLPVKGRRTRPKDPDGILSAALSPKGWDSSRGESHSLRQGPRVHARQHPLAH